MAKIWEIDFTRFDPPSSDNAQDNIGNEHITNGSNITKTLLPGFTYRFGVFFNKDDSVSSRYTFDQANNPSAVFTGTYSKRSFVMWYYCNGNGSWEGRSALWGEHFGFSSPSHGLSRPTGTNNLRLYIDYSGIGTYPISFTETAGWKLVVCTVDRSLGQCRAIGRSAAEDYDSGIVLKTALASEVRAMRIGDDGTSREISAVVAYMATYDHILSTVEIDAIEEAFIQDSVVGESSVAQLEGFVVDEAFQTVSGADVTLYNNDLNLFVANDTATASGEYSLDVPYYGNYTVTASHPPNVGSTAVPFTVTGSGGSPGVITFHEGG